MPRGDNDKKIARNVMAGAAGGAVVGTGVGALACNGLACGVLAGGPAGLALGGLLGLLVGVGKVVNGFFTPAVTTLSELPDAPDEAGA